MECAETGPHTPHSSFIEVRICILILCAECSYRQRAEEYAVLGVHEVAVDAHLLAFEAYGHVSEIVVVREQPALSAVHSPRTADIAHGVVLLVGCGDLSFEF